MDEFAGLSVGVDVVDIEDFSATLDRSGAQFISEVFTRDEIAYCGDRRPQHYGVRWAAKEAFFKATNGALPSETSYRDVEITLEPNGAPRLRLSGAAAAWALRAGLRSSTVSLSHSRRTSMAAVILRFRSPSSLYGRAQGLLRGVMIRWRELMETGRARHRGSSHQRRLRVFEARTVRALNIGQAETENGDEDSECRESIGGDRA
jgi:phosphopantetheine--protein transferase-like protein